MCSTWSGGSPAEPVELGVGDSVSGGGAGVCLGVDLSLALGRTEAETNGTLREFVGSWLAILDTWSTTRGSENPRSNWPFTKVFFTFYSSSQNMYL